MRQTILMIAMMLTWALPCSFSAGASSIKGRVVDAEDGKAILFADVIARGADGTVKASCITGEEGFLLEGIESQTVTVEVMFIGYRTYNSDVVNLKQGETYDLGTISLEKDAESLKGVTVTSDKNQIVYRLDRQSISASSAVTAAGGTALDILANTPSIQVNSDGDLTFRGSSNYLVYVDGKPSPLEGTDALRQIPASSIDDIEIITTPSARYKTDGDVGIINIKTKASDSQAFSGTVGLTGSTLGTLGFDGILNYRKGRNLFYIGATAQDIKTRSDFLQDKKTVVDDYVTISRSDGYRYRTFMTEVARGGWQFNDGKAHKLQVEIQGGRTRNTRGGYMLYNTTFDAHDHYILYKKLMQASVDYEWKIGEKSTLAATSRLRYDPYSLEYTESNLHTNGGVRTEGTRGYEQEHHWDSDGSLTFTHSYSETGSFESGYQYTTYSEHGGYTFKAWDNGAKDFLWDDSLDIPFYYRRQVHTLYAMVSDHPGNWELNAGLRGEEVIDVMDIEMYGASRHRKRYELYPSAHAAYRTGKAGTFGFGYSRRTNRPGIWKLEPYITYEDYYTRIVGNPDLNPEYIHSLEAFYRKSIGSSSSVAATAYYRHRSDVVDVIRIPYEPGITLDKIVNAGNQSEYGMEFSAVTKPARWWTSTLNGNIYRYAFISRLDGCSDNSGVTWMAGWINVFSPLKDTKIQFDSHLIGPNMLTQGHEEAYCFFDLAARRQFMKGRLALSLVAHDVFHTAKYENFRSTMSLESHTTVRPTYPNIVAGLTFTFNSKVKEKSGAISTDAGFDGKDF